ncbi:hypothetical protein N7471_003312 [Penicillium samsonianum]|uniref:uncharacterized protein n=1 Tax=Penicillium samsonianum TaxID=1882272 RepID=UPI002546EF07|nr:uncharacterized protein N7471_003312 [Penicillium samsonianum]KAJ6143859.1 hypothetical protein N7471_003312 [Penicillium samsonianum]
MSIAPQSPTSKPRLNVHYLAPGFSLIPPETVDEYRRNKSNLIFSHGVTIVKISLEVVVKIGAHVNFNEARNMIYIAQNTGIPVPKALACYTYGPIDRDPGDHGGLYDTYIFTSLTDGNTLDTAWDNYEVATKTHISTQLTGYIQEMRDLACDGYIGSVDHGPVANHYLSTSLDKGPFKSEEDFKKERQNVT